MKKTLIVLFAALLLVSATACGGDGNESDTTVGTGVTSPIGTGDTTNTAEEITNEFGEVVTNPDATETQPAEQDDISEENPTFTDVNKTLYVWSAVATVRTSTVIEADNKNAIGWPSEGTTLVADGESANWYRIKYDGETRYIAKTVVGDNAVIEAFTSVENEEIEISADVNVRSFPSTEGGSLTIRGALKKGTKVTRVGKGDGWSCILYEVTSEIETDAEGNPVKEIKQYYISNTCIVGEDGTATEAATEEVKE